MSAQFTSPVKPRASIRDAHWILVCSSIANHPHVTACLSMACIPGNACAGSTCAGAGGQCPVQAHVPHVSQVRTCPNTVRVPECFHPLHPRRASRAADDALGVHVGMGGAAGNQAAGAEAEAKRWQEARRSQSGHA